LLLLLLLSNSTNTQGCAMEVLVLLGNSSNSSKQSLVLVVSTTTATIPVSVLLAVRHLVALEEEMFLVASIQFRLFKILVVLSHNLGLPSKLP